MADGRSTAQAAAVGGGVVLALVGVVARVLAARGRARRSSGAARGDLAGEDMEGMMRMTAEMLADPDLMAMGMELQPPDNRKPSAAAAKGAAALAKATGNEDVVRAVENLLGPDRPMWVEVKGKNVGDEEARALAEAVKASRFRGMLKLTRNLVGDEGARALAEAVGSLSELGLYGNEVGDEGARAIAEGMKASATLKRLYLQDNKVGDEGARAIAEGLKTSTSLKELDLYGNRVGPEGARAIAEALKTNTSLKHLGLGANDVGDEGARAFAEALKANRSLVTLGLERGGVGNRGARAIAEALKHNFRLAALGLNENKFSKWSLTTTSPGGLLHRAAKQSNGRLEVFTGPMH